LKAEWELSDDEKACLRRTWTALQANIEAVGTVTFLQMFETHPETLKPFIPEVESIQELELNEW
jgi:hemoglobin-like flavoprotein